MKIRFHQITFNLAYTKSLRANLHIARGIAVIVSKGLQLNPALFKTDHEKSYGVVV